MPRLKTTPKLTKIRCSRRQYQRVESMARGVSQWAFMQALVERYESTIDEPIKVLDLVIREDEEWGVRIPVDSLDRAKILFPGWRHHQIMTALLSTYDHEAIAS